MPDMHLRLPVCTYSTCRSFTKKQNENTKTWTNREHQIYLQEWTRQGRLPAWYGIQRYWRSVKKNDLWQSIVWQSICSLLITSLNKAWTLVPVWNKAKRLLLAIPQKQFISKSLQFPVASNPQNDRCQHVLTSMIYNFFDKKSRDTITYTGAESISEDQKLAKELHRPIARKFQWPKLYLSYQNSIWDADLANMELISKYNKRAKFLLCVIDIYSKCAWVSHWETRKLLQSLTHFKQSGCKWNQIWFDRDSEPYNRSLRSWLQANDIKMYPTHNKRMSPVAERFIETLKNKID